MSVVLDSNGSNSTPSICERIRGEVCGPTDIAHCRSYQTRGYNLHTSNEVIKCLVNCCKMTMYH